MPFVIKHSDGTYVTNSKNCIEWSPSIHDARVFSRKNHASCCINNAWRELHEVKVVEVTVVEKK